MVDVWLCRKMACSKETDVEVVRVRDFPSGPVIKTLCLHCRGTGSNPGQGTKIPYAVWCGQRKVDLKCHESVIERWS